MRYMTYEEAKAQLDQLREGFAAAAAKYKAEPTEANWLARLDVYVRFMSAGWTAMELRYPRRQSR